MNTLTIFRCTNAIFCRQMQCPILKVPHLISTNVFKKYSSLAVEQKSEDKPNCNIGTIGHIDHGKTTLSSAITKYLERRGLAKYISYDSIDSTREEKLRGITVNATHINYSTEKRNYAHTDCPGHADYIRNMIAGTSQMDGAVVVVAANDGPMPQTREHLLLAKQIGVEKLVVFINKADIVDQEVIDLVEIEMREMLDSFGFDGNTTPVVVGSALLALKENTSEYGEPSIKKLLDEIDQYIETPVRDIKSPYLMAIDNAFTVTGRGSVVVGTVKRGIIKKNDILNLMGFGKKIKTSAGDIQAFKKSTQKAEAGDHIGVLLRGLKLKEIERGMVLCAENSIELSNRYIAEFYLLTKNEGGRSKPINDVGYTQQLFSATWDIACRIDLRDGLEMLIPGEHATVDLTLLTGMVLSKGQTFTIRENNVIVGTGRITSILPSVHLPNGLRVKKDK